MKLPKLSGNSIAAASLLTVLLFATSAGAAPPPAAAVPEVCITAGQPLVPPQMHRIWGELVKLDLTTRTGTFRNTGNDELMAFVVLPYAELLHHATFGDLPDFRVGERALFRLHEDEQGRWRYLTYIQDEMNFLNNHKEWYWIDEIKPETNELVCHQANFDQSFMREKNVVVTVDPQTQYWRQGQPVHFQDLHVGDRMQIQAHGVGKGKTRVAWHVFLDSESLAKFQTAQKAVHERRMRDEGFPAYVDEVSGDSVKLTLFLEARDWALKLKSGMTARLSLAGADRKPVGEPMDVRITSAAMRGSLGQVSLQLNSRVPADIQPKALVRLWVPAVFSP